MSGRRKTAPSFLLLLACAAAGGALYLQRQDGLFASPPAPIAQAEMITVTDRPLVIDVSFPDRASFDEIAERPLFSETRSPPEPPPPPPKEAEPPPPLERDLFTLMGVAISGAERVAIVRSKKSGSIQQVAVGDELDGWRVDRIETKKVVFVNGNDEETVEMQDISGPDAGRPGARPPRRPGLPSGAPGIRQQR